MRSDKYVPNSYACFNNSKYFQIDTILFERTYETTDMSTLDGKETVVFNGTATISGYLPDAIYYCYFLPQTASQNWALHYESFEDIEDFEGAFIQNIAGNMLTLVDIYNETTLAASNADYLTVCYQLARMVRRLLDF